MVCGKNMVRPWLSWGGFFLCRNTGNTTWQETNPAAKHAQTGKGRKRMKVYKKIMNGVEFVEKLILVLSTILIVVLTVGNVLSRKILHQSWSFTEELVVAVFVLITLLAAALAARDGELVNLSLLPDRLSEKARRILLVVNTAFSVAFTAVLFKYGMDKVLTQLANGKRTFVLNWPEWIFWSFVPIGAACMTLHMIEYLIDTFVKAKEEGEEK